MLREYVVSEAMHALGIPTTRVAGRRGDRPRRCAARPCCRARCSPGSRAATCGSAASSTPGATGDVDLLRRLADHAIARHHPAAAGAEQPYLALFEAVVAAQASLVARWMLVGFVHGVMNTDNMTISGETIDYGPCAFMDAFDPATVYSSIDTGGRYAYGNQPVVAEWNLARLAEALLPLLARRPGAGGRARGGVARRLPPRSTTPPGRPACGPSSACPTASTTRSPRRWSRTCSTLLQAEPRRLHVVLPRARRGRARRRRAGPPAGPRPRRRSTPGLERWRALGPDADAMDRVNPVYIPRNHLVEEALAAATDGDLEPLDAAARRGEPTRSTSGPGSSATPPRPRRTSAPTGPSAAPDTESCTSGRVRRVQSIDHRP